MSVDGDWSALASSAHIASAGAEPPCAHFRHLPLAPRSPSPSLASQSSTAASSLLAASLSPYESVESLSSACSVQSTELATAPQQLYDAATIARFFKEDGFTEVFQWQDGPSTAYDAHTHPTHNTYYILRGDMDVHFPPTPRSAHYRQGDRFDVAATVLHSVDVGPHGCVYMVGSKRPEPSSAWTPHRPHHVG